MSEVHQIIVQIKPPNSRKNFHGQVTFGYYTLVDDVVTLTDRDGKPAGVETGKKWRHKLEPNENARSVAARMTKQLRLALLPGGKAPVNGFDRPLQYPKLKY
jgi:hypothetical protein